MIRSPGEERVEQPAVGDRPGGGQRVGERDARDDAVQDAGVGVGDLVLLDGAARAAPADGELHRPVGVDEVLLHHHRGLGRDDRGAVVVEHVERGRRDGVTQRQELIVEHAARGGALVVAGVAAATEGVDELAVPARVGTKRRRGLAVVQRRDLVDASVDYPGLQPHDVRHALAVHARHGQVSRDSEVGSASGTNAPAVFLYR